MSEAPGFDLDPIELEIFDLLRRQPGDIFSPEDIAAQLDYQASEVQPRLERLEQRGLVVRAAAHDDAAYILSPGAPEL